MIGSRIDDDGGHPTRWSAKRFAPAVSVAGTWSLVPRDADKERPRMLVLTHQGAKITGAMEDPAAKTKTPIVDAALAKDGTLTFAVPDAPSSTAPPRRYTAKVKGDVLEGAVTAGDSPERKVAFTARRERRWADPIELFNGKDLDGWKPLGKPEDFRWRVIDGVLTTDGGANIVSERKVKDFKLHVEFRVPPHGNSGVYLRGRYEIQIEDSFGQEPASWRCGGLYTRITPTKNAAKPAGEWQTFDATLTGQYLTLLHNGVMIIDNQEIEGPTGGAIDSRESEPGPIYLQGDHGKIEFRKITVTPALD